jgi:hypothetical protein
MPARPTSIIAHVAATGHRVQRPHSSDAFTRTDKNNGLARSRAGASPARLGARTTPGRNRTPSAGLAQQGFEPLRTLPAEQLGNDADALSSLEMISNSSDPERAVTLGRRIVELRPQASCAPSFGLALKLYDGEKRTREAVEIIERFLKWNPRNIRFRLAHAP